jgi:hypothetical protein
MISGSIIDESRSIIAVIMAIVSELGASLTIIIITIIIFL